ncbi:DUF6221 family protein [Streptomyces lavendofoliae]|uniref:DUF6221 family protein n=1 Tax=Streptomyces lavendofoliae TaxID=67314 RepID=UPI00300F4565
MNEAPIRLSEVWAFCSERLDDDDAYARAASEGPWRYDPGKHWRRAGSSDYEEGVFAGPPGAQGMCIAGTGQSNDPQSMADAAHIARHDPTRVLAEVAFKRELLAEHEPELHAAVNDREVTPVVVCRIDGDDCPFTRGLAALYDDHPDYKETWRP